MSIVSSRAFQARRGSSVTPHICLVLGTRRATEVAPTIVGAIKVYVVDDDPVVLDIMHAILEPDCQVETFPSAEDCLMQLESEKPDFFLLDVNLPGQRTTAQLTADAYVRELRTAQNMQVLGARGGALGAQLPLAPQSGAGRGSGGGSAW